MGLFYIFYADYRGSRRKSPSYTTRKKSYQIRGFFQIRAVLAGKVQGPEK